MYIDPNWRILTVGDGDLSFSRALCNTHAPTLLEASVYDSESELINKYARNDLESLRNLNVTVHTSMDITDAACVCRIGKKFDAVVFQFPLIQPLGAEWKPEFNTNILNRRLLRYFLIHSFRYLFSEDGPKLCYITSKDVYPYCEWNIEESLNYGLEIPFLGSMKFNSEEFPGYRIRNVRRDTMVSNTRATTYVWGHNPPEELSSKLTKSHYPEPGCCAICRAGPFVAEEDRAKHFLSDKHKTRQKYEDQWMAMVGQFS